MPGSGKTSHQRRMSTRRAKLVPLVAALALLAAAPAMAQDDEPLAEAGADQVTDGAPDRESTILVYGDDACPPSTDNEVVVCARRPEEERYRIPRNLRRSGQRQEQAWGARVESLEEVSRDMRPNSCSVVGTYGQSGCLQAMIRQWYSERRARAAGY
jgi:hypothetical protein